MAKVRLRTAKCPECGARLEVDPNQSEARCEYCGTTSRVEDKKKAARQAPPPPQPAGAPAQPVIKVNSGASLTWLWIVLPVFIGLSSMGGVLIPMLKGMGLDGLGDGLSSGAGQLAGERMQWVGNRQAMLADLTGDGVADPIGWVRFLDDGTTNHVAAFDAVSGRRLWQTPSVGDSSRASKCRAALAGDKLLVADSTGVLKAYSTGNGAQAWSVPLGERVERFCGAGGGWVRVEKKDEQQLLVDPSTGQTSPGGEVEDDGQCGGLWTDVPGRGPRVVTGGDTFDNEIVQPIIEGMNVDSVAVDFGSSTYVALGGKHPGTAVPMAAAYAPPRPEDDSGKGKKKGKRRRRRRPPKSSWMNKPEVSPRWMTAIPAVDPMTVRPGAPDAATISVGRLVAPYQTAGRQSGWRLAALDVASGRNLWDVAIPSSDTGQVWAVTASDRQVFASIGIALHVFELATGQHSITIGGL
ncbi:MAG: PQQ-binding-like beta-propeller repeat protein [Polyangia bacterium]